MTEAFWWYLLAGFIVGFTLSTMWEWLYFRRRRMRIENRRIAELEAMLRSYAAAEASQAPATGSRDTWATPPFDDPGAYLDIEDAAAVSAAPPADLPPMRVAAPPGNSDRGAPSPATSHPAPPGDTDRGRAPTVAATTVTTAAIASGRTQPPAQTAVAAAPPQTYAPPRSGPFPTAAAQTAPPPVSATQPPPTTHTIPNGLTAHYPLNEPPTAPFPSAAAQPVPAQAPLVLAARPAETPPSPQTTNDYTQAAAPDDRNARAAVALGTAGTAVALAATRPQEEEPVMEEAADKSTALSPGGTAPALAATGSQASASVAQEVVDEPTAEATASIAGARTATQAQEGDPITDESADKPTADSSAGTPPALAATRSQVDASVSQEAVDESTASTPASIAGTRSATQAQDRDSITPEAADRPTADSSAGTPPALAASRSQADASVAQEVAGKSAVEPPANTLQPIASPATSEQGMRTPPLIDAEPTGGETTAPPAICAEARVQPPQADTLPTPAARTSVSSQATATTSQPVDDTPDRSGAGLAAAAVTAVAANEALERKQAGSAGTAHAQSHQPDDATRASTTQSVGETRAMGAVSTSGLRPAEESASKDETPITPAEIDALVASIHELIEAVNQDRTGSPAETAALMAAASQLQKEKAVKVEIPRPVVAPEPGLEVRAVDAEPSSRVEEALVLLIKSVGRFIRQVRSIFSGEGGQAPQLQRAIAGDTLLSIDGMTQQHIDRLGVAGITSPADLARLSEAELRMLLLTPGGEPAPDYSAWLMQAGEIAGSNKRAADS